MNQKDIISVVIPCYKCERYIKELYSRVVDNLQTFCSQFEIIFINDASPEKDWEIIKGLAENDKRVVGIDLSRNFGQHYAITAGLEHSAGDWVVVMDGDLQDQPEEISKLYMKAREGYDAVIGLRLDRKDSFAKKFLSKTFYKTLGWLTDTEHDHGIANFGIYNRLMITKILEMHDYFRFFPLLVKWVGFNTTYMAVNHSRRSGSGSSYSLSALTGLALNVILTFSDKPLRLIIRTGFFISGFSFCYALYIIYRALAGHTAILGWASLIVSIWLSTGIIMVILGIIGIYIGKIFEQVKLRPKYICREIINA